MFVQTCEFLLGQVLPELLEFELALEPGVPEDLPLVLVTVPLAAPWVLDLVPLEELPLRD